MRPPRPGVPPRLSFSEHQHGFFGPLQADGASVLAGSGGHYGDLCVDIEVYESGCDLGIDIGSSFDFTVHIAYADLAAALADPATPASMSGTAIAPALSSRALTVTRGTFELLRPDTTQVETSHMTYTMDLRSIDDEEYRVFGFKVIHEGPEWAAWPDSTTLYVTIRERRGDHVGKVLYRGITRLSVGDVAGLLRSMQVGNVKGPVDRLRYTLRYGRVLGRSLFEHYGGTFDELGRFPRLPHLRAIPQPRNWQGDPLILLRYPDRAGWKEQPRSGDKGNACSRLIRYASEAQPLGPVILAPGFGMPSWSLTTRTIQPNLVEFLIEAGYEVWLFDYHSGSDLPSVVTSFTLDDIVADWKAALAEVTGRTAHGTVQCVAHCVGSATLLMAVLSGATGVRSMVCGQYTLFPYGSELNLLKNYLGVGDVLALVGIDRVEPDTQLTLKNVLLDLALRPIPLPAGERCGSSVCRWINAIYGLTHRHAQLNQATHEEIGDIFGVGSLDAIRQIGLTMVNRRLVDRCGRNVYLTDGNVGRLSMPIHFLFGARNYVFRPKGARASVAYLREKNPAAAAKGYYSLDVLPTYSHLDTMIGRDAPRDVFPTILDHLDRSPPPGASPPGGPPPGGGRPVGGGRRRGS